VSCKKAACEFGNAGKNQILQIGFKRQTKLARRRNPATLDLPTLCRKSEAEKLFLVFGENLF